MITLAATRDRRADAGLLILRAVVGVVFLAHGWQKLFVYGLGGTTSGFAHMGVPMPEIAGPLVAGVELIGGIALMLGLWTRVFGALLACDMVGAMIFVHLRDGFFVPGIEFVLTLCAASLALTLTGAGMLSVDEYRNGERSLEEFPARIATLGLAAQALIFHPYYVEDFEMSCEGLGQLRGQPAWQVHFRQRNDRPSRFRVYRVKQVVYPVKLKGRAWIAADTLQVVRLETDLAEEIPAIRLQRDHLTVDYRAVQFQKRGVALWLPESVEFYFDFRGHRYHRRHSFSDFLLFSVDISQQIQPPQTP